MRIVIACDSFKDALDAPAVCEAIADGLKAALPSADLHIFPLADGGEGTAEILALHKAGQMVRVDATDPLGRPVVATYGWSPSSSSAYVEMAAASGLPLLSEQERDPLLTSTYGTGQVIAAALDAGAEHIFLCLGGSATNDGGLGMARALGFRLLDETGHELAGTGADLGQLHQIDVSGAHPRLRTVRFTALCDVDNPLLGPAGATYMYGPQKGADSPRLKQLEAGMQNFSEVLAATFGRSLAQEAGAGAAGGLGAGAMAFLQASLEGGAQTVLSEAGFDEVVRGASWVITGEGKLDAQTAHGKLIDAVCSHAGALRVPVVALCGKLEATPEAIHQLGLRAAFSISPGPGSLQDALQQTEGLLQQTAYNLGRLLS